MIHQRILPDVELREVSQSLKNVADVIKGKEADCNQFQLMKQLILMNEEDYKATITALARIVAAKPQRRTNSHNLYVPDTRSFDAVHTEIIQSLRNFLEERLSMEDELGDVLETLRPENLSNLSKEKVKAIHDSSEDTS